MATTFSTSGELAGSHLSALGAVGGGDLRAAAEEIASRARELASGWSAQIPGSIEVEVRGNVATISTAVPPAYPNETGARHPVYARGPDRARWTWVRGNHRPFLGPAADERAGAALARYAKRIDRMAREAGFDGLR